VFVVKDGKVSEIPIETGAKIGDLVEIRRGPQPGDKVVLKPSEKMRDGTAVKAAVK
jgi:multidrug efflux pump subunit AcrA (membrane-fusion protein)